MKILKWALRIVFGALLLLAVLYILSNIQAIAAVLPLEPIKEFIDAIIFAIKNFFTELGIGGGL